MNRFLFFSLSVLLLSSTSVVFAQTTRTLEDYGLSPEDAKYFSPAEIQKILNSKTPTETMAEMKTSPSTLFVPPSSITVLPDDLRGTANCFDYYHFGSVQTDFITRNSNVTPGSDIEFSGTITNNNDYPVVDGSLYIKILKERSKVKEANGPDVVDQFVAKEHLTLAAHASIRVSFLYHISSNARAGNYRIVSFFITDQKFNLLGLSFTDDVVGNIFDFQIGGKDSSVYFDKSSVIINSKSYFFAVPPPRIADADSVAVSAKVTNTTSKDETVDVIWKLYRWDSINPENLIHTIPASVTVKAGSTATVRLTIPDKEFPVYYLVAELSYKDIKSFLNIRFVRSGVDRVRLNFPSITSFPLLKGVTSTMFTCVHNSGTSAIVPDGKIVLELIDDRGASVALYTYDGGISGEMMAVKKDFVPKKTLDTFTLRATLYQAGNIVDKSSIVYSCKTIDPDSCNKLPTTMATTTRSLGENTPLIIVLVGIVFLIIIAVGNKFRIFKKKRNFTLPLLLILFLFPLGFLLSGKIAEAKSVTWNQQSNDRLAYFWDRFSATGWATGLRGKNVSISYNVLVEDLTKDSNIPDGGLVTLGDQLKLKFMPHVYSDISWFGTGYSADSPFGEWKTPIITPPTLGCYPSDFVGTGGELIGAAMSYDIYIPLLVKMPTKSITIPAGLTCGSLLGDETIGYSMLCTVNATGSLSPTFNFGSTHGKFYYRYYDNRDYTDPDTGRVYTPGCYGNSQPMDNTVDETELTSSGSYWGFPYHVSSTLTWYSLIVPEINISYNLTAEPLTPLSGICTQTPISANILIGNSSVNVLRTVTSTGGTSPYSYRWSDGPSYSSPNTHDYLFTTLQTGISSLSVTIQDSVGGTYNASCGTVNVIDNNLPPVNAISLFLGRASDMSANVNKPTLPITQGDSFKLKWINGSGTPSSCSASVSNSASFTGFNNVAIQTDDIITVQGLETSALSGIYTLTISCPDTTPPNASVILRVGSSVEVPF
ncbi:MAG: hypothetical protein AAB470_02605 [Patescibacteria group bacterium]